MVIVMVILMGIMKVMLGTWDISKIKMILIRMIGTTSM